MIPEDDARTTLELDDRYVVAPCGTGWSSAPYLARGARPVAEGFRYASDTNSERLEAAGLMELIAACPA